jgi:hypothetical protein
MAKLDLTRGELIEAGLDLAARPDLISQARLWLNLFFEDVYMNQDFDWLIKTLDGQSLSDGMNMPADYRAAKSAMLHNPNGSYRQIEITNDVEIYDNKRDPNATDESPLMIYANHDLRKFYLIPGPGTGYTLDLKYFYIPELPDYTDPTTDADVVKWGLPSHIIIDFIKAMAFEYNEDSRQGEAFQNVMAKISQSKANNKDSRAGSSKLKYGKSFKKRIF